MRPTELAEDFELIFAPDKEARTRFVIIERENRVAMLEDSEARVVATCPTRPWRTWVKNLLELARAFRLGELEKKL